MNVGQTQLLFLYNQWANDRLLMAVGSVSPEDFLITSGSPPSLRERFMHIMVSESVWLARWKGIPHMEEYDSVAIQNQSSLRARWKELENDQINFISKISDESLEELVEFDTEEGEYIESPLWKMIDDMVKHSIHHRGQVAEILRIMGKEPPDLQFTAFLQEKSS